MIKINQELSLYGQFHKILLHPLVGKEIVFLFLGEAKLIYKSLEALYPIPPRLKHHCQEETEGRRLGK